MKSIGVLEATTKASLQSYPIKLSVNDTDFKCLNIGNVFNIDDSYYVLTCFHCIKNTYGQVLRIENIDYDCHIHAVSDELELGLLTISPDDYSQNKLFTINDLQIDLNIGCLDLYIETIDIDELQSNNIFKRERIGCTFNEVIQTNNSKLTSLNSPQIPIISVTLNKSYHDISELTGLSGSFLMADDKILGIVSALENSIIYIIPSCVIYRFLNEIQSTKSFSGLCTIVGNFTTCDFENEKNEEVFGLIVDNTFDINYNNYSYVQQEVSNSRIKKNDILIKINELPLDRNGYIYDHFINAFIDFRTYIALKYMCGDIIDIVIMRCTNNINDYKEKKIKLRARPIYSMRYIPITFNSDVYNYKGFIFTELSEDIINNYISNGIQIGNSVADYYLKSPYRSNTEFVIILFDIDKTQITKTILKQVNKLGLPLKHINAKIYSVPYIFRLNNKKVISLNELTKYLESNINNIITFNVYQSNKIRLTIKNNDIYKLESY